MNFKKLISYILAIQNLNKDIHYSCGGSNFYSDHLLVDKFSFDYIDDIGKEETGILELYMLAFELAQEQLKEQKNE